MTAIPQPLTPRGQKVATDLDVAPAIIADWKAQGPDDRTYQERLAVASKAHEICQGNIYKGGPEISPSDLILFPKKEKVALHTLVTLPDQTSFIHLKELNPLMGTYKEKQLAKQQPTEAIGARLIFRAKNNNLDALLAKYNREMRFREHIDGIQNIVRSFAEVLLTTSTGKYRIISYQRNYTRGDLFYNLQSLNRTQKDQIIRTILRTCAAIREIARKII